MHCRVCVISLIATVCGASSPTGGTWYTTYSHVSHYITNKGRSLMLESREYTVFDLTDKTTVTIEINSTQMVGRILTGTSFDYTLVNLSF